jgi:hypothetical protein
MGDGNRTLTVTLTEAQYDTFVAAMHEADQIWKELGIARSSNRQTLLRGMGRLSKAWQSAKKG